MLNSRGAITPVKWIHKISCLTMWFFSGLQWFLLQKSSEEQYDRQYSLYSLCGWDVLDNWLSRLTNLKTRRQEFLSVSLSHPLLTGSSTRLREDIKCLFTRTLALFLQGSPSLTWLLPSLQTFLMDRSPVDLVSYVSQAVKEPQSPVSWLFDGSFLLIDYTAVKAKYRHGFHIS